MQWIRIILSSDSDLVKTKKTYFLFVINLITRTKTTMIILSSDSDLVKTKAYFLFVINLITRRKTTYRKGWS